jgi:hypothetical protein
MKCKYCKKSMNMLGYVIDVRHQFGWCIEGGEEE